MGFRSSEATVSTPAPARKYARSGRVIEFTRHPRELAVVRRLPLQACARFVLSLLLCYSGGEGASWRDVSRMAAITPRSGKVGAYSLAHFRRALRQLRDAGFVRWDRILPLHRLPRRTSPGTIARNQGERTYFGGRVFWVNIERLRQFRRYLEGGGIDIAGWIMGDPSGWSVNDPSSDQFSSTKRSNHHARSEPARDRAPAAPSGPEKSANVPRVCGPQHPTSPPDPVAPPKAPARSPPPDRGALEGTGEEAPAPVRSRYVGRGSAPPPEPRGPPPVERWLPGELAKLDAILPGWRRRIGPPRDEPEDGGGSEPDG